MTESEYAATAPERARQCKVGNNVNAKLLAAILMAELEGIGLPKEARDARKVHEPAPIRPPIPVTRSQPKKKRRKKR